MTQMVIVGLGLAASMVFVIGLLVGAGTTPPKGTVSQPDSATFEIEGDDDDAFPRTFVAVTTSDELVAVDVNTGKRRDLVTPTSDSGAPTDLGFGAITMPTTGRIVYYERRSDSGPSIWRVSTSGGPAQRVINGREPAVSPDGLLLASLAGNTLVLTNLATEATVRRAAPGGTNLIRIAWAPTSRALVVETRQNNAPRLFTTQIRGGEAEVAPLAPLAAPSDPPADFIARLGHPSWRVSDGAIVSLGARGGASYGVVIDPETGSQTSFPLEGPATSADYDSSGTYFGYVLDQGVARWKGAGKSGRLGEGIVRFIW